MTPAYMRHTTKDVMFSESCSEVSVLVRRGVSAEQKSMTIASETYLILNGWNIPFVSHVKYIVVTFDKRINWRLYIEMTEAKVSKHLLESTLYSKVSV
jgi:hypothetical protein